VGDLLKLVLARQGHEGVVFIRLNESQAVVNTVNKFVM
jgi:hypothetical protein